MAKTHPKVDHAALLAKLRGPSPSALTTAPTPVPSPARVQAGSVLVATHTTGHLGVAARQRVARSQRDANMAVKAVTSASAIVDATSPLTPPTELEALQERSRREKAVYWDAVDSEFWVALCFHTRLHKEAFLRHAHLTELGDKYLDGQKVAEVLGIPMPPPPPPVRSKFTINKRWIDLTEPTGPTPNSREEKE